MRCEGHRIPFSVDQISAGFKRLRHRSRLDCNGVSVFALELLFVAHPDAFTSSLSELAGSSSRMSQVRIEALIFGKESANTDIGDTRIIMPLPSISSLLDSVLPFLIEPLLARIFPAPTGVWFSAMPKTQVLDITHGLSSVLEKGLY